MRTIALFALISLVVGPPSLAEDKLFGYANPTPLMFGNITVNTETIDWEYAYTIPERNALGIRPIVVTDLLFFEQRADVAGPCSPYMMQLRQDWMERADDWIGKYSQYLIRERIAGIALDSESNNQCISPAELQTVAQYLLNRGISRELLGTGNGIVSPPLLAITQFLRERQAKSRIAAESETVPAKPAAAPQPLLSWFPQELAWVAIFAYDYLDPQDQGYQKVLEELKSLLGGRRYLMVIKGFLFPREFLEHSDLGAGTVKFARYCKRDPQCMGVIIFLAKSVPYSEGDGCSILGTEEMPEKWPYDAMASRILLQPPWRLLPWQEGLGRTHPRYRQP